MCVVCDTNGMAIILTDTFFNLKGGVFNETICLAERFVKLHTTKYVAKIVTFVFL